MKRKKLITSNSLTFEEGVTCAEGRAVAVNKGIKIGRPKSNGGPFFYTIITGAFFEIWSLNNIFDFNVMNLFNLMMDYTAKGINVIIYDFIFILLGIFLLFKFGYKKTLAIYANA